MAVTTLVHAPVEEIKPGVAGAPVPLGRVDVYPSSPMPEFDTAAGPAYAARIRGDAGSDLIAIVCTNNLPARMELVTAMRSVEHPSVLRLAEHGVIAWADGARYAAFAYHRPSAPRYMRSPDETHPPMSEDAFNRHFLHPLVRLLADFMRMGIVHGAIRPTNMFWRFNSTAAPQLGECLSAPCGINQPVLFETIERGMAMPIGRGTGSHMDDCYALGVTAALIVLGHNPLKGMDDRAITTAKMEQGTFNALVGHHRLSAHYIELLRGLLTDDAHQRWTAVDIEQWLSGRRLTPKSSDAGRRSSRHVDFAGKEYWQVRPLAKALSEHVSDAAHAIESGMLDKWLRRSLNDEERANDVADAIASAKETAKSGNYEDQLVARVCCALDPAGPIRYRGLSVMPGGISNVLAQTVATGGNVSVLAEIISSQLITFWIEMHKHTKADLLPLLQQFERLTSIVERTSFGSGIERALYELNPSLPCLSPILRSQYVTTPRALMPALERVATSGNRPHEPMDRHIAAFLIVRDRRSEMLLEAINSPELAPRHGLSMLSLYSDIQNRHGPESLPHFAQWLLPLLEPCIRRYFGKSSRESVQKQIKEVAARGDLRALARLVDNPERIQRDEQEFVAARLLYLNILKEINMLEGRIAGRNTVVQNIGKPMAAMISSMLALLAVMFAIGRAIWHQM